MKLRRGVFALFLTCVLAGVYGPAAHGNPSEGTDEVTSYLAELVTDSETPGIQYIIVDSSGVLFRHAGGWADVSERTPIDMATTMMAYSMSKTITAVAVLQLVEEGKIGLDDPLDQYFDLSPYGPAITIRQLLSHTSGIPNPIPLRWAHLTAQHDAFSEEAALAEVLAEHSGVSSQPGVKYRYSNIGYWLLGLVVERASGQAFTSFVTESVLGRLGIMSSELGYTIPEPATHANGYLKKYSFMNLVKGFLIAPELVGDYEGNWLRIESHYLNGPAFGGLVGTAEGIGKFLQDQLREESSILGEEGRAHLYAQQRTSQGTPVDMTLGWHIGDLDGSRFYYKEGGGGGHHCLMRVYPDLGLASVVMANSTSLPVHDVLDTADGHFLR